MSILYLNGRFVDEKHATVSALDRGLLYGDGLFETMRAYGGRIFRPDAHLARLAKSAKALRIPLALGADRVEEVLRANRLQDAYLRITLTRGVHTGDLGLDTGSPRTLIITAREFHGYPPTLCKRGMKLAIAEAVRPSRSLIGRHKTLNYLENLLARDAARKAKCYESLFLDERGFVAECSASNIFFVRRGVVYTPSTDMNILPGITRSIVVNLCRDLRVTIKEGHWRLADLRRADEVFLTNSLMEVMPANGPPGPVTRMLAEGFRRLVDKECET